VFNCSWVSTIAAAASANATQELLRHLDSKTSRYFFELVESGGGGQYETVTQLPTAVFFAEHMGSPDFNLTHGDFNLTHGPTGSCTEEQLGDPVNITLKQSTG
jgi:hypothetical protein